MSKLITGHEISDASTWLKTADIPDAIRSTFEKLLKLNDFVAQLSARNKSIMSRLAEFLGVSPKSEKADSHK